MKGLFTWMLVLIAAAIGLFVALVALQPAAPPSGPLTPPNATTPPSSSNEETQGPLIPPEIEGFQLMQIERVEPQFEGERFSVHASFAPTEGSPFADFIESLGVSVFQLTTPLAADQILPLLALSEPTEVTIDLDEHQQTLQVFVDEEVGLAGALWREDTRVYYVLIAGKVGAPGEKLQEATLTVAKAVLQRKPAQVPASSMMETQTPSTKAESEGD